MSEITIFIPTFPPSPLDSPSDQDGSFPDWFKPCGKLVLPPQGLISSTQPMVSPPPLSPFDSESSDPSSDEGEPSVPSIPRRPREHRSYPTHRRSSEPSYFTDASFLKTLSAKPSHRHRARFASMPVSGSINPMWSIDEESGAGESSDDEEVVQTPEETEAIDPFKMLLPFCTPELRLTSHIFNDKEFVLSHVPHRRVNISSFRPRIPWIPRWQRPLFMAVLCIVLFGSACVVSWMQQAGVSEQRASMMRRNVWLARVSAETQAESEVAVEPGYKPVVPSHHSLKVQQKIIARQGEQSTQAVVNLEMTPQEELAALMSFITGTSFNALPAMDTSVPIAPEVLLPFNPRSAHGKEELDELVRTQWEHFPIMVLGKLRDPAMIKVRKVLKQYVIKPQPVFVDFDQRSDAAVLETTLQRLLGKQTGPYVLLQGKSLDKAELSSIEKDEEVVNILAKVGARVAKKLKKNKHAKEEERRENDRVLGPRAIRDE